MKFYSKVSKFLIVVLIFALVFFEFFKFNKSYSYDQINTSQLNSVLDIDNDIYVQHDENNHDVYLLNSEGEYTTVYKIINVTYTASKQWTRDGLYIDDLTGKIGATAPEDYISVKENEVYFVRLYGIGDIYKGVNGDEWHITSPIVYFDDNGNCVGNALSSTVSSSKQGVEITIPAGATRMYISNYNNQTISIQKKLILNSEEFNAIKLQQDKIFNYIDSNYDSLINDPVIYGDLDKAYITFVGDDSRPSVDKYADLFIRKNVPLCFAAIADNLLNNASNLTETRLDVALRVQEAGGEILAHNGGVVTASTINDNNFMYSYFVVQKQMLSSMGLNVNGIILAGGSGQITGSPITAKWTSALYKYSDLLGERYETPFGIDSVYYHRRGGLSNYNNDIEKLKLDIDKAIENKSWNVFYFHDTNEISLETMELLLDYINSKSSDEIEVVTYNTMYEKFATRESNIKNDKKTYYVSSDGTSIDGTDINNPTNLETINNKVIKSGDTILFKRGDTFYGTLDLSVFNVDDNVVNVSSYGNGELPTFSSYKYVSNGWEKYSDNVYRIDIKNIDNFIGYEGNSTLAYNVGFIEDDYGNKYYNKKISIESLSNMYDFYSDGSQYLYLYANGDPYILLGNLKVVVRSNLMSLSSNMRVSNIRFSYTGGHAIVGSSNNVDNIKISNCIIENIGGSYLNRSSLSNDTRYGNGIEFYNSNASNIDVSNNIFRNIYDVAFTIQGNKGSGKNVYVHDNVFVNNSQDSEIWESGEATGVYNYKFYNNLSINQGRGWGYEARKDKYPAASILFWGYEIENTEILFSNNVLYNPRQIYYLSVATDQYFLNHDTIKSDNNIYYMSGDTSIYRNNWKYETREEFINTYKVDYNSKFELIEPNIKVGREASVLNDINKIRLLVLDDSSVIESIELLDIPSNIKVDKGSSLNIDNFKLRINYLDGLYEVINLEMNMLSNINYQEVGIHTVTVNYLSFSTSFDFEVVEEPVDSDEPIVPDEPDVPVQPEEPVQPEVPVKPEESVIPSETEDTEEPEESTPPKQPVVPDESEEGSGNIVPDISNDKNNDVIVSIDNNTGSNNSNNNQQVDNYDEIDQSKDNDTEVDKEEVTENLSEVKKENVISAKSDDNIYNLVFIVIMILIVIIVIISFIVFK